MLEYSASTYILHAKSGQFLDRTTQRHVQYAYVAVICNRAVKNIFFYGGEKGKTAVLHMKRRVFVSRYQVRRRGTNRTFVDRRGTGSRLQGIVIIVLLVILVIGLIYAGPALKQKNDEEELIRGRMLAECEGAVTRVQRLSRTAGSNSSQTLGEIRSYIYTLDVLNQTHFSLTGKQLLDTNHFSTIYSLIETYWSQLLSGSDTGAMQTTLTNALSELYLQVQKLN